MNEQRQKLAVDIYNELKDIRQGIQDNRVFIMDFHTRQNYKEYIADWVREELDLPRTFQFASFENLVLDTAAKEMERANLRKKGLVSDDDDIKPSYQETREPSVDVPTFKVG